MDLESTLHNNGINNVNDNQQQSNSKTKITRNKRKCTKPVCDLPFDCPKPGCNKTFKRSEHLKRHLNSVHNPIKSFICSYIDCGKAFSRSDNLNQHIRTHIRKMVAKK
ncbi:hypothetical protein K502DRAFT_326394 [Neoconidiobolus thromboides FSU 785]|nr:hypothetical protein K502DRAFT_326394 [Neoconidiobolus thromboides FSU 785]